jgi:signal transduction histidine kinase/ligand-binding sensor domain-containing protein
LRNLCIFRDARFRKRLLVGIAVAGTALVYFAAQGHAVDPHRLITEYLRDSWGNETGFPSASVSAIAQSSDGYLWIGTEKDLVRFDGLNFRTFRKATPGTSDIGPVQELQTDSRGNLWILLQSTRILRYRDGKFEPGREETEFGVTALGRRKNGGVLFSSVSFGTLTYDSGKFELLETPSAGQTNNGATARLQSNDELSSRLSWDTSIASHHLAEPNSAVTSIAESADGKVWLGTGGQGLFYLTDGRVSVAEKALPSKITCLLPLEDGKMWIGTENGIQEWVGRKIVESDVPLPLRRIPVLAMLRDRDSNIWVGTAQGLARVNRDGLASIEENNNGKPEPATALFEDREGNIWVGHPQELERLRDRTFVSYPVTGRQTESGGPVYVDAAGRIWFAPFDGGLQCIKDGKTEKVTNDRLNEDVVYSIARGGNDDLWVGRQQGGLTHLSYVAGRISAKTFTHKDGLAQNGIFAVHQSRDGSVWGATLNGGVGKYSDGHFVTYSTANGMTSDTVTSMDEGPDGTIWYATPNGLDAFSNNHWRAYRVRDGMPSDNVSSLLWDSGGVLWIGTASGLAFLRSGRIEPLRQAPSPLDEPILGIAEDGKGRLWIATSSQIFSVKRDPLLAGSFRELDLRVYGTEDGLLGTEGVKRERSVIEDNWGRVWFSTNRGLSVIDPARAVDLPPAIVQIESVSVDGNTMNLTQPILVPPGSHRVIFSYSGLTLSVPARLRFKYKLDGFDQDWSEPVSNREAVYTNLDSGGYRFRLLASNSEGLWNSVESALPVEIQPFFWNTWWFRVATGLVITLALLLYLRLRDRNLTKEMNLRFEERLSERTRIARELHDSVLQGFQGLMFRLQAVRDLLPERPGEAAKALDSALDRGDQVISEGRSTVEDLRHSSLKDNDIVQALSALGRELEHSKNGTASPDLRVMVEGSPRELDPVVRDEVYRIAREALRNAFQHARAEKIEAQVTYGDAQFSLCVRDDGNGIDPNVFEKGARSGHWGLPGMRERAAGFGGQLHVWSESGAGTEIELTIPAPVAYLAASSHASCWFLRAIRRTHERRH